MNIIDKRNSYFDSLLRNHLTIDDKNMFVTNFILYSLLESINLGTIDYDKDSISKTVNALLQFRDKNSDDGVPIYNFWSQRLENNTWTSYPQVLYDILYTYIYSPGFIKKIIEWVTGISPQELLPALDAFRIPPDNDDTGLNLVIGSHFRYY